MMNGEPTALSVRAWLRITELREAFGEYDPDDNGSIEPEDLGMVATSKGLHLSDQELIDCLKVHDMSISGNGVLEISEFVKAVLEFTTLEADETVIEHSDHRSRPEIDADALTEVYQTPGHLRTNTQIKVIQKYLHNPDLPIEYLTKLPANVLEELCRHSVLIHAKPGRLLHKQGDRTDEMYIVVKGKL